MKCIIFLTLVAACCALSYSSVYGRGQNLGQVSGFVQYPWGQIQGQQYPWSQIQGQQYPWGQNQGKIYSGQYPWSQIQGQQYPWSQIQGQQYPWGQNQGQIYSGQYQQGQGIGQIGVGQSQLAQYIRQILNQPGQYGLNQEQAIQLGLYGFNQYQKGQYGNILGQIAPQSWVAQQIFQNSGLQVPLSLQKLVSQAQQVPFVRQTGQIVQARPVGQTGQQIVERVILEGPQVLPYIGLQRATGDVGQTQQDVILNDAIQTEREILVQQQQQQVEQQILAQQQQQQLEVQQEQQQVLQEILAEQQQQLQQQQQVLQQQQFLLQQQQFQQPFLGKSASYYTPSQNQWPWNSLQQTLGYPTVGDIF